MADRRIVRNPVTGEPTEVPNWLFMPRVYLYGFIAVVVLTGVITIPYTIPQDSVGVVTRFGKYVKTSDPGLQFKLPYGIDSHEIVPVRRQLKMEFGFGTPDATNPYQVSTPAEREEEKSMITGDRNAVTVEWVVQYRVDDPVAYLFKVRNPDDTLRDVSESVMREVVGDRLVDEVLTVGRQDIENVVLLKLEAVNSRYSLGLKIDQVQLKNVTPPRPVQASFNEVNQAQQERERLINEARGRYNRAVPRARGEADRRIAEAEGQATRRINEAEGDAKRFSDVFVAYQSAAEVTRQRLFLETMAEVLPTIERRILVDPDTNGVLPLMQIGAPTSQEGGRR
ncbi:MAG: FtsH protease activity modulator HflK [Opitutales bacterium]